MIFPSSTIDDIIKQSKKIKNVNTILPPQSKNEDVQRLRGEIIAQTKFLPKSATIRERLWYIENGTQNPPLCTHCKSAPVKWDTTSQSFRLFCSYKCSGKNENTIRKKQKTCKNNLGVLFPAQSNRVKEKYKNTMISRYGVPFINQQRLQKNDTYSFLENSDRLRDLVHAHNLSTFEIADRLNIAQSTVAKYLKKYAIETRNKSFSTLQRQIVDFIKEVYTGSVLVNDRDIINPQELDVVIPDKKIAFEIDSLYWHSETSGKKDKNYHLSKSIEGAKRGYRVIHIFETDWTHHKEATKSRIVSLLGESLRIFARCCNIVPLQYSTYQEFYEKNHIQGCVAAKITHGLMYKDTLVAAMSFSKSRFNKKYDYELIRYCSASGTSVVGGASKLLSSLSKETKCSSVISYCDKRWGDGTMYQKLGFTHIRDTPPNYWYIVNDNIVSRVNFQKHKLSTILKRFDSSLSEWDNMKNNNYDRIWDCGNSVWTKHY